MPNRESETYCQAGENGSGIKNSIKLQGHIGSAKKPKFLTFSMVMDCDKMCSDEGLTVSGYPNV